MRSVKTAAGFTLVEVLVATMVLTIGVLGAASMLGVANRSTSTTAARTGAINVARRVAEAARGVPARTLQNGSLVATLAAAAPDLPDADPGDSAWTVAWRGVTYAVTASTCTQDDPADGTAPAAQKDSSYCASTGAVTADAQPADAQQVAIAVTYAGRDGSARRVRTVMQVPVGANGAMPAVTSVAMTSPAACSTGCSITSQATTNVALAATTTNFPARVTWLVDGNPVAVCPPTSTGCNGSGNAWTFSWSLRAPVKETNSGSVNYQKCIAGDYTYDGVLGVGARGEDANGLTAGPTSLTVSLNRCAPIPVAGINATGRDGNIGPVDVAWYPSTEGDVLGYRVYRGTSLTTMTPVCPASVSAGQLIPIDADSSCTDTSPPNYSKNAVLYYAVTALDRDPAGALREGAVSWVNVNTGNNAPNAPTGLSVVSGVAGRTVSWTVPGTLDPDSGDTIDSFRIYRRTGAASGQPTVADRLDVDALAQLCTGTTGGSSCSYVDATAFGPSTYWVTSVDTHLRESAATGPKTV